MAYFLGRDVKVYIGTESDTANKNIGVLSGTAAGATEISIAATGTTNFDTFACSLAEGATVADWGSTNVTDLVGVDVSVGAMDEDITYIGQKGTGKVEVKNEYTISLTCKKSNSTWDTIFNGPVASGAAEAQDDTVKKHGARWGLGGDFGNSTEAAPLIVDGLANPKDYATSTKVEAGYRLFIVFKSGATGETMAFPNCLITAHTVSVNADGTTEQTMEFVTQQKALQGTSGDTFNVTQTTVGEY